MKKKVIQERPLSAIPTTLKNVNFMSELPKETNLNNLVISEPQTDYEIYQSLDSVKKSGDRPRSAITAKEVSNKVKTIVNLKVPNVQIKTPKNSSLTSKGEDEITFMTSLPNKNSARKESSIEGITMPSPSSSLISELEGRIDSVAISQDKLREELAVYVQEMKNGGVVEVPEDFDSIVQENIEIERGLDYERPDRWDHYVNINKNHQKPLEETDEDIMNAKIQRGLDFIKALDEKLVSLGELSIYETKKKIINNTKGEGGEEEENKRKAKLNKYDTAHELKDGEIDHIARNAQLVAKGGQKLTLEEEARVAAILGKDYVDEYDDDGNLIVSNHDDSTYLKKATVNNAYALESNDSQRLSEIDRKLNELKSKQVIDNNDYDLDSVNINKPNSKSMKGNSNNKKNSNNAKIDMKKQKLVTKNNRIDYLRRDKEDKEMSNRLQEIDASLAALTISHHADVETSEENSNVSHTTISIDKTIKDSEKKKISNNNSNNNNNNNKLRHISSEELEECKRTCLQEVSSNEVASRDQIEMLLLSLGVSRSDF